MPINPDNAQYLGDGVYVVDTSDGIRLTTGHHSVSLASNVIYLDPTTLGNLLEWCVKYNPRIVPSGDTDLRSKP